MFRHLLFSLIVWTGCGYISAQVPDSVLFDWSFTAPVVQVKPTRTLNVLQLGMDPTGKPGNDSLLQKTIDDHKTDSTLIIYFPKGTYRFTQTIRLRSNMIIRGEGAGKTVFLFQCNGSGNLFEIRATPLTGWTPLAAGPGLRTHVLRPQTILTAGKGDHIELMIDGTGLATSKWALNSIGQILTVDSIRSGNIYVKDELRLNYPLGSNPKIRQVDLIKNVHFEFFKIQRLDSSAGQTSNFYFYYAHGCSIKGVESDRCNFSHVSFSKSYQCRISDSYFHHSFGYGEGGRAYGIELGNGSCSNLIENSDFYRLRHAILLQSGANGNVISGNYCTDPFWQDPFLPSNSAGELVLHGNYPYANLFEGNMVGNIVIDNSHGINGPGNMFFRNRASLFGLFMNDGAGDKTAIVGNEITGYFNQTTGKGNTLLYTYTLATDSMAFETITLPASLFLKEKPWWWPRQIAFPALGIPYRGKTTNIPAYDRFQHDSLRALNSAPQVFWYSIQSSVKAPGQLPMRLWTESNLQVNTDSVVLQVFNTASGQWKDTGTNKADRYLFRKRTWADTLQITGSRCYRWKLTGLGGQSAYTDSLCFSRKSLQTGEPVASETVIRVFPNPCNGQLNIVSSVEGKAELVDLSGKKVMDFTMHKGIQTFDITSLPKGIYAIRLITGGDVSVLKVIHN